MAQRHRLSKPKGKTQSSGILWLLYRRLYDWIFVVLPPATSHISSASSLDHLLRSEWDNMDKICVKHGHIMDTICPQYGQKWTQYGHNMDTRWTHLSSSWLQPFIVINMSICKSSFCPRWLLPGSWLHCPRPLSPSACQGAPILSKSMLTSHSGYSLVLATPSWWPLYQSIFAQLPPLQVFHAYEH